MKKELYEIAQCIPWVKNKLDDSASGGWGWSCDPGYINIHHIRPIGWWISNKNQLISHHLWQNYINWPQRYNGRPEKKLAMHIILQLQSTNSGTQLSCNWRLISGCEHQLSRTQRFLLGSRAAQVPYHWWGKFYTIIHVILISKS